MSTQSPSTPAAQPPNSPTINVGDIIGRDKIIHGDVVHGDKVMGDKIDAQGTQGFVNRPTGPVTQNFGPVTYEAPQSPSQQEHPLRDSSGLQRVRIFVASPVDVLEERTRLSRIIDQLNRGAAKRANFVLELIRWETHAIPGMGRPEQVILDQLAKEEWDIFIGVLWLRFGSPTGAHDQTTGTAFASGTEEEFQLARQMRDKNTNGWPKVMFYRCTRPPVTMANFDIEQYKKVEDFFKEFAPGRSHEGLYHQYITVDEFEDAVREHIESVLYEFRG